MSSERAPRTTAWVGVSVPATSANLGPGFDCVGLALELRDEVRARVADRTRVTALGEGEGTVPSGEEHLVARVALSTLRRFGVALPGLELRCRNAIPHARGLGSSAAAIVAGLGIARALLPEPAQLSDDALLRAATQIEGHPDNAAPALFGGATVAYVDADGPHAVALPVADDLRPCAWIPSQEGKTSAARAALPPSVRFADAAYSVSRAALLPVALQRPDLLYAATDDRLHQSPRSAVMPETAALLARLRESRVAAAISGAGPALLSFGTPPPDCVAAAQASGWRVQSLDVARDGLRVLPEI